MFFLYSKLSRFIFLIITVVLANNCSPKRATHGLITDDESLQKIATKEITKSEIREILGSPSSKGTFSDNTWYYIIHRTEEFAFYETKNIDQLVIQIKFKEDQRLNSILAFDSKDGRNIPINPDKTPSAGSNLTILQQLFGNIGRYDVR